MSNQVNFADIRGKMYILSRKTESTTTRANWRGLIFALANAVRTSSLWKSSAQVVLSPVHGLQAAARSV